MTVTRGEPPSPPAPGRRLLTTSEGSSSAPFTSFDWALVALAATVWGGSFLLIAEGLETLEPGLVAWIRLLLGSTTLMLVPRARATAIDRADWARVALLGFVWFAVPQTMFPIAELWVSSAVAGMLNGALPLFAAAVSAAMLRRAPGRNQLQGLTVGFAGVVCISVPSLQGGSRTALGTVLILVALICYALAGNVMVPLQQRYGAIGVIARAQLVALVLTTPYAAIGVPDSSLSWRSAGSVIVLGVLGTGVAFVAAGTLMGRVGATRGSLVAYLIPVVALVLGVLLRDEHVAGLAVAGLGLVLAGAWLTSRHGH